MIIRTALIPSTITSKLPLPSDNEVVLVDVYSCRCYCLFNPEWLAESIMLDDDLYGYFYHHHHHRHHYHHFRMTGQAQPSQAKLSDAKKDFKTHTVLLSRRVFQ